MKKILIVEDEVDILETIIDSLELEYEPDELKVVTADNGEHALQILPEHDSFDIVITDLNMPKIDGAQLIKSMKEKKYEAKYILFTGHGYLDDNEELKGLEITSIVSKPFIDKLLEEIRTLLS